MDTSFSHKSHARPFSPNSDHVIELVAEDGCLTLQEFNGRGEHQHALGIQVHQHEFNVIDDWLREVGMTSDPDLESHVHVTQKRGSSIKTLWFAFGMTNEYIEIGISLDTGDKQSARWTEIHNTKAHDLMKALVNA